MKIKPTLTDFALAAALTLGVIAFGISIILLLTGCKALGAPWTFPGG